MKLIVVGTDFNCMIRLDSQYVSSYHAEILLLDNGDILLTDKGSKNGTYLNDQRLQPNKDVPVKRGDVIRFADRVLDWKNIPTIEIDSDIREMRGIGTNFRNKYQLQGEKVSRYHATFSKRKDGRWYIQDHSKNGTSINGKKIPAHQNIKIKRGDVILCAGVAVPNPYTEESSVGFSAKLWGVFIVLIILFGCGGAAYYFMNKYHLDSEFLHPLTDEEIHERYQNSIVLVVGYYYYEVSAGALDLSKLGLPTEVVVSDGMLKAVNDQRANMNIGAATGFFVSEDGKIVTDMHVVKPWHAAEDSSLIANQYRKFVSDAAMSNPAVKAFASQIKVEGVLSYVGVIPNGAGFSEDNIQQCRILTADDGDERNMAVLQLESKELPDCHIVNLGQSVTGDSAIYVGAHIYSMGFPAALAFENLTSSEPVLLQEYSGDITQDCDEFSFGIDAPAYEVLGGSPVFNEKGQLIGILDVGNTKEQGCQYVMKASYVLDLMQGESCN